MTQDRTFHAVQSFLEDDELHKIWNIIERWREKVMTYKTQNFQWLIYDSELAENKGYYNQPEPVNYYQGA